MPRRTPGRSDNLRRLVALEAARLMSEQGIDDFYLAKRKAADRLGVSDKGSLPRNSEIEAAMVENQRLFDAEKHAGRLRDYRSAARDALHFFADFNPHAAGAVLSGAVAPGADLEIHLFADTVEAVILRLVENNIPYRLVERRVRTAGNGHVRYPACRFVASDIPVLAMVFPTDGVREAPLSPVDGRPMRRARLADLASE
ncbi:MAG: hypothetical protein KJO54_09820 [Gammaproteobacteria bacterium]|nr:hypothetical protein [Gammaproteobacteria bacterium]NNF62225.1 hypothetical protein [Gammaproteobacteria bacterium]NNM21022.1 hypothetical protein [Gammaproteobacteria bacterium]